jgi:hypothetical protein
MLINEGFGVNSAGPLAISGRSKPIFSAILCLARAISSLYCWTTDRRSVRGDVLFSALSCIRTATALAAVAIVVAGCAAANNATSAQASTQDEQPYKTMYGMTSDGPTTDLYTEIFGSRQPPPAPATNVASAQPVQPVASQPVTPVQQGTAAARPSQTATTTNRPGQTTAANRTPQPAYGQPAAAQPVQVALQPAPPAPPPEADVPAAYGITANGPTTDLYTEIFGPRRSNGQ